MRAPCEGYDATGQAITEIDVTIPEVFQGLERFAARKEIVSAFDAAGLLEKIDEHTLMVPYGDRSGVVIEPLLTDQWFVRAGPLAEPAIKAVEDGDIQFVPKQYENMYFSWMRDIQDWCISRQLWWGHRIPAWYDAQGNVYVARTEAEARTQNNLGNEVTLTQDEDVLDTWFSSALWTFGTLGWPEATERLRTFHPTDVLVTGFDIIFFWVARMIMMTMHFMKDENGKAQVPFKYVYVTGLIRDENGDKMSKSKGNVLDPLDMIDGIDIDSLVQKRTGNMMQPQLAQKIEKRTRKAFSDGISAHGTDALRFTLYSLASTGRDINWDMKRLEGYRNFCNKIWNAARYVLMNVEGQDCAVDHDNYTLSLADRWIISRLQQTEKTIDKAIAEFRLDLASQSLYDFIWNEYCDWYLELSKPILSGDSSDAAQLAGTRRTLVRVLEAILRLAHPFMPFITEEIWQKVAPFANKTGSTIMTQDYPIPDESKIDQAALDDVDWLKGVIVGIRNIRGEMDISPAKAIPALLNNGDAEDKRRFEENQTFVASLAKLDSLEWSDQGELPMCATQLVGKMEVLVPMAGLINVEAELARLSKEIGKAEGEIKRLSGKLSNEKFVRNAPVDVVAKEKEKLAAAEQSLSLLSEQMESIKAM